MAEPAFTGSFTLQEPIPEDAVARAVEVLRSGRLHRYNTAPGETSETALMELEFAAMTGARHCLACASGGYAMQTALRAFGVAPGEPVLTNAFTLSPVPGAVAAVGARPELVETTEALTIDFDDLAARIEATGARVLLLSHMRGHIANMDALGDLLGRAGVALIEDCAHTMGANWRGRPSGSFGLAACFSTQTYKHVNSGEGGLLTSDDPALMARATILSGSYMLYGAHPAGPPAEAYDDIRLETPNCSGRMDDLRAAILRPQLARLGDSVARWNALYRATETALAGAEGLGLIRRPPEEGFVGSSIQFLAPGLDADGAARFLGLARARGVELKWFGAAEPSAYTSSHHHWAFAPQRDLPRTDAVLRGLFDMRLPLTFSEADCTLIGGIIRESLFRALAGEAAAVAAGPDAA